MDFDSPFESFGGLKRRSTPDPFSDAARFPTLAQDQQAGLATAAAQHSLAAASGPNSVAGRNDPLRYGSVLSRQFPGLYDASREQARQNDPSNAFYNGLQRRSENSEPNVSPAELPSNSLRRRSSDDGSASVQQPLSAIDRHALSMGYGAGENGAYDPTAAGTYAADMKAHSGPSSTVFDPSAPNYMRAAGAFGTGLQRRTPFSNGG